jgi:hypothetical protein
MHVEKVATGGLKKTFLRLRKKIDRMGRAAARLRCG